MAVAKRKQSSPVTPFTQSLCKKNLTMQTQAYFDDIQLHILHELGKATSSIHIAVAWFTDPDIFEHLCRKAGSGVRVELLIANDSINRKSELQYDRLRDFGGMFMMVGDNKKNSTLMHNKFCVIDGTTVITGSYNWSRKAQQNNENITVISEHPEFARQFLEEFESLVGLHSSKGGSGVDFRKIMARLEVLRHVIELDDDEDIVLQLAKLKKLLSGCNECEEVHRIVTQIEGKQHDLAIAGITTFVHARKQSRREVERTATDWRLLADKYYDHGDTAGLLNHALCWSKADFEDADAWFYLGIAYQDSDQLDKAIEAYQRTLGINSEYADAWNNLGVAYQDSDQLSEAIKFYQQAIRTSPENAEVWHNLGIAYKMNGQTSQVMDVYKRLKVLAPTTAEEFYRKFIAPK
ncbi:MAG: phospholipase D-like domain-containing protein [Pseudomonadota bacterium]